MRSAHRAAALSSLLQRLDTVTVGHMGVKRGLLLGLIAREHVYIEGSPGIAKTLLGESIAAGLGLNSSFHTLHRDTRLQELVGDTVVVRSPLENGELIESSLRRGGILNAELAILDDLPRAPGEATVTITYSFAPWHPNPDFSCQFLACFECRVIYM